MSASSAPISPTRFAAALESLSVSSLHAKAAELRNSIAHLQTSNAELEEFLRQDDDKELYEAVLENREVIKRMEERIALLKREVTEVRGLPWAPEEAGATELGERTGGEGRAVNGGVSGGEGARREPEGGNGTRRDGDEEGVFL